MLIGNVGKEPETRYSGAGMAICSFSLATSSGRKDKATGQFTEVTDWHNIVTFERTAEIAQQYVKKGDRVYIEGKIQTRTYDDKDGNKKYFTEVVANDLILLGSPGGRGDAAPNGNQSFSKPSTQGSYQSAPQDFDPGPTGHDDLPF